MVTGASRGVGRGVAIALAEAGFQVFATGRSIASADLLPAIHRITCDHLDDSQTRGAFEQLPAGVGSLDILVNSAWGGYERMLEAGQFTWPLPFWEQPLCGAVPPAARRSDRSRRPRRLLSLVTPGPASGSGADEGARPTNRPPAVFP